MWWGVGGRRRAGVARGAGAQAPSPSPRVSKRNRLVQLHGAHGTSLLPLSHSTGGGRCVGSRPKRRFVSTRSRENLSSGEKRAGWADAVGVPSARDFCVRRRGREVSAGGWRRRMRRPPRPRRPRAGVPGAGRPLARARDVIVASGRGGREEREQCAPRRGRRPRRRRPRIPPLTRLQRVHPLAVRVQGVHEVHGGRGGARGGVWRRLHAPAATVTRKHPPSLDPPLPSLYVSAIRKSSGSVIFLPGSNAGRPR